MNLGQRASGFVLYFGLVTPPFGGLVVTVIINCFCGLIIDLLEKHGFG